MYFKKYMPWLLSSILSAQACAAALILPAGKVTDVSARFAELYSVRQDTDRSVSVNVGTLDGVTRPFVQVNLPNAAKSGRVDFTLKNELYPLLAERRWYAMSVFLPPDWRYSSTPITLAQIDSAPQGGMLSPPLALVVRDNKLMLSMNFNHMSAKEATEANSAHRTMFLGPATLGKWQCLIVGADWSATPGVGNIWVYLNNNTSEVFNARLTLNSYTNAVHVPRVGLVAPAGTSVGARRIYADFIWVGNAAANYYEMIKKTPCAI